MHPRQFIGREYAIRQADTEAEVNGRIRRGDIVSLEESDDGEFVLHSRRPSDEESWALPGLRWDPDYGSLRGEGERPHSWIEISFYQQSPEPYGPLHVLYGVVIDRDPQSVGTWAADDNGGGGLENDT